MLAMVLVFYKVESKTKAIDAEATINSIDEDANGEKSKQRAETGGEESKK